MTANHHKLPYQRWTVEEDAQLWSVLYGLPRGAERSRKIASVADAVGRTEAATRTRWQLLERRHDKTKPRDHRAFTPHEDERILEACSGPTVHGMTYVALSKELDRTVDALRHRRAWLKERGDLRVAEYKRESALRLPVSAPPWMKPLTRAQLMAGR